MNFLVTGGAGFIGSHLCNALVNKGNKVICLDNFDEFYPKNIKKDNIKDLKENPKFHLITGDVRDTDNLIDIMTTKKIDTVVHLAGKCGAINSLKNPMDYISFNINGTVSLLEAMKESEVNKLVFTSSSSVYGNSIEAPFRENIQLSAPTSPYGASKQSAEMFIRMYHEMFGLSAIVLRLFSVYGPRQRPDSGMYQFIKANLKEQPIAIYGDGQIRRDYTYIDDIISGIEKSIEYINKKDEESLYEVFNMGSSSPVDINSLFEIIEKVTGQPTKRNSKKSPLGNLQATHADLSKTEAILQFNSTVGLEEGVKATVQWMQSTAIV